MSALYETWRALIHLIRAGHSPGEAAQELGHSRAWGYKWWRRYQARQCWPDLHDHSCAPKHVPRQWWEDVRQAICRYRDSRHHSQLHGRSPREVHQGLSRLLPPDFELPDPHPLTTGKVHFIRATNQQRQVKALNLYWDVPLAQPRQGVWVTLDIRSRGATLRVFDAAPDASRRTCLAAHPFPLPEEVQSSPLIVPLRPSLPGS